ncbi:MAG: ribonuclease HII [Candidatus Electronema sp. V4]|uniref:ribonuclease HII n=1 Tax=Candidatus Electronema sp. V4 TaxID=3454756 RepID=UPI004055647B
MDEAFLFPPQPGGDTFFHERRLHEHGLLHVAGVDEAGRGPLAGPVTAACVILPPDSDYSRWKDSKKLTPLRRERLYSDLRRSTALIGIGLASAEEIDQLNIHRASLLAMRRAVENCADSAGKHPDYLLVDGLFKVPVNLPQLALVKGESKSASIAAASIVAKVIRDHLMADCHEHYPQYNFLQHKGYPTKAHRAAIAEHGPSPIHRRSFHGVREFCR